jgi:hypothetical protein
MRLLLAPDPLQSLAYDKDCVRQHREKLLQLELVSPYAVFLVVPTRTTGGERRRLFESVLKDPCGKSTSKMSLNKCRFNADPTVDREIHMSNLLVAFTP